MSVPADDVAWEPSVRGVELDVRWRDKGYLFDLTMEMVRELRDDMEEAAMLARGYEKNEVFVQDLHPGDQLRFAGDNYTVVDTLLRTPGWVVQVSPSSWIDGFIEFFLPGDLQVTAYRVTE